MKKVSLWLCIIWATSLLGCSNEDTLESELAQGISHQTEQYIVVLNAQRVKSALGVVHSQGDFDASALKMVHKIKAQYQLKEKRVFTRAVIGGTYQMTQDQAAQLAKDPDVAYVEKDGVVTINTLQSQAPWGLDRLDQANLPLNRSYEYFGDASNWRGGALLISVSQRYSSSGGERSRGRGPSRQIIWSGDWISESITQRGLFGQWQ